MFSVGVSKIHGVGLIASVAIQKNTVICTATTWRNNWPAITDAGKYVNHSYQPNSKLVKREMDYDLVATAEILPNEEITADYTFTPWFLEKPGKDFL